MKPVHCPICFEVNIKSWALTPCLHPICYRCATRLRVLFKSASCPLCKTLSQYVLFAETSDIPNLDVFIASPSTLIYTDTDTGFNFYFTSLRVKRLFDQLINLRCPLLNCDVTISNRNEFISHVEHHHRKFVCSICFANQNFFLEEIQLFDSASALRSHMQTSTENRFSVKGKRPHPFSGHPECKFCHLRYYSNDELFTHCRQSHESCFICTSNGVQDQYYEDYKSLESHFSTSHFICKERACIEEKFVVFPTIIDLKAHLARHHPELSKGMQRYQNRQLLSIELVPKDESSHPNQKPLQPTEEPPFDSNDRSFPSLTPLVTTLPRKKPVAPLTKEARFPPLSSLKGSSKMSASLSTNITTTHIITPPSLATISRHKSSPSQPALPSSSSSPHEVFPQLQRKAPIPTPSIPTDAPPTLRKSNKSRVFRLIP